jgi:hypothetical protein
MATIYNVKLVINGTMGFLEKREVLLFNKDAVDKLIEKQSPETYRVESFSIDRILSLDEVLVEIAEMQAKHQN